MSLRLVSNFDARFRPVLDTPTPVQASPARAPLPLDLWYECKRRVRIAEPAWQRNNHPSPDGLCRCFHNSLLPRYHRCQHRSETVRTGSKLLNIFSGDSRSIRVPGWHTISGEDLASCDNKLTLARNA